MKGWKIVCAGLVFVAVSTTVAAGIGLWRGELSTPTAWLSFLAGALAAYLTFRHSNAPAQKITRANGVLFLIFAAASLRAFLWIIYERGNDLCVLSPHNLGDMSLHLNLIRRWAAGGDFWPENPFLAGAIFPYHPGMDLWNALLARVGVPVYGGLRIAGLLGAAATAVALWRWGRGFAVASFLFAGGLSGVAIALGAPVSIMEDGVAWKNLFLSMFVTQRGLLYSLPAGLVLMCTWRAQLTSPGEKPHIPLPAQVALYGTMPLFNAPAFLFLSLALAVCFIASIKTKRWHGFFALGAWSIVPATWLVSLVTSRFTAPSAFRFEPGWMQDADGWWFWVWNFGAWLPLAVILGVVLFRRNVDDRGARTFYLIGAATLAFAFLFILAPWAWDNTKLIIWGYLAVVPFIWSHLVGRWPAIARGITCIALFFSGAVTLYTGLDGRHGYGLAKIDELSATRQLLRDVPIDTRIAGHPTYNHPALLLGYPAIMGYEGHLFSQGLDYHGVRADLDELMSGGPDWRDAAKRLRAEYVFWGAREKETWPASTQPWPSCAMPAITAIPAGTLYFIKTCFSHEFIQH